MTRSPSAGRERLRNMTVASLLAALMCVSAYLVIPLQPVPVTLQMLVVVLTALLLPPVWAGSAMGLYLLLGVAGLPVFSSGQAGLGTLAGPTGGFLVGFLVASVAASALRRLMSRSGSLVADTAAAVVVIAVVYAIGTARLAQVAHLTAVQAAAAGAWPFLVPDALKSAVAVAVARGVRRATAAG